MKDCHDGTDEDESRFECKRKNFCSESSCDVNAHCINHLNFYKCECNYGFTGDGMSCSSIEEVDECHSRLHDCSKNALCFDQRYGYTCVCNNGFIDRDSARPGRRCESLVPSGGCCEEFAVFASPANTTEELIVTCSIENYSKFKFSPLRQSYKCNIDESFLEKNPIDYIFYDYYILLSLLKSFDLSNLYFEYDGDGWSCVDRDENMNLKRKYDSRLETVMDKISYHNDLCFFGDFDTSLDLYGRCLRRIGLKNL